MKPFYLFPLPAALAAISILAPLCRAQNTTRAPSATPTPPTISAPAAISDQENETVVIVAETKTPKNLRDATTSVSVISGERIELLAPRNLSEVLREVPGLSLAQTGTLGKQTSIFLRGTESNHTLVLIDGVRANSGNSGAFDFGQFPPENIERIEVLRGPGSALYGADALGGVVNIITRRGAGPLRAGGNLEFGGRSDNRQTLDFGGQIGKNRVSFSGFRLDSAGQFQNDDYRNTGVSLRFDRELGKTQNLSLSTRFSRAKFGVPGQRALNFNPFRRDDVEDLSVSLLFTQTVGKRRDLMRLGLAQRELSDDDTRFGSLPPLNPSRFDESTTQLEAQSSLSWGANLLTVGLETRRQNADILSANGGFSFNGQTTPPSNLRYKSARRTNAVFVQNEWKSGALTLIPGMRYEKDSQFGGETSLRLAGALELSRTTRLRASIGTATKAPTFSDLFFPGFSNPLLAPERSRGVELGLAQTWNSGSANAALFQNDLRDLIAFSPTTFAPENIARARTRGLEISFSQNLGHGFRLIGAQTFLSARAQNSERLLRRPKTLSALNLIYKAPRWSADLGFSGQGNRLDNDFTTDLASRAYSGFGVFNLTLGYRVRPQIEFYGRAGNLFNRSYEEVAGFPAPRFHLAFGVRSAAF